MWGALTSRKVSGSGEKWEAEGVFRCSAAALATSKPRIKGRLVHQENKILDLRQCTVCKYRGCIFLLPAVFNKIRP